MRDRLDVWTDSRKCSPPSPISIKYCVMFSREDSFSYSIFLRRCCPFLSCCLLSISFYAVVGSWLSSSLSREIPPKEDVRFHLLFFFIREGESEHGSYFCCVLATTNGIDFARRKIFFFSFLVLSFFFFFFCFVSFYMRFNAVVKWWHELAGTKFQPLFLGSPALLFNKAFLKRQIFVCYVFCCLIKKGDEMTFYFPFLYFPFTYKHLTLYLI